MVSQAYTISTVKNAVPPRVKMSQYDSASRTITFTVVDASGATVDLTGKTATVEGTRIDGHAFVANCTVSGSTVTFTETVDMTNAAGDHPAELVIRQSGQRLGTMNFVISVEAAAMDENASITPEDESLFNQLFGSVDDAIAEVDGAKDDALQEIAQGLASGAPLTANTVAAMTDTDAVYLYTGSESGYTAGSWYYYNGSAWVVGGVYGSGQTDATLSLAGVAADAKATGDAIEAIEDDLKAVGSIVGSTFFYVASIPDSGGGIGLNWNLYYGMPLPIGTKVKFAMLNYSGELFTNATFRTRDSQNVGTLYQPALTSFEKVQEYTIYTECSQVWIQINRSAIENGVTARFMLSIDTDGLAKDVAQLASSVPINSQELEYSVLTQNQDMRFKADGTEEVAVNWILSDYIPVGLGLRATGYSYSATRPGIVEYNANKTIVGVVATDSSGKYITKDYAAPSNVAYVRIQSIKNIGYRVSAIAKIRSAPRTYFVEKDGSGDFDKLSDAIIEATRYMDSVVYVGSGTWDLIEELGIDTNYIPSEKNRGLVLKNRIKVVFSSNSKVTCNYTGTNSDTINWLSAFNSGEFGFTLENATIESSKCRYSVHDERNADADSYNNYYINCRMTHDNANGGYNQCIGGGLGLNGHVIIDGCIFANPARSNYQIVYYHNTSGSGKSFVEVKGSYFKDTNTLGFQWYGTSPATQKSTLFAHGNSLGSTIQHTGAAGATIENTEVIAFDNEIRS